MTSLQLISKALLKLGARRFRIHPQITGNAADERSVERRRLLDFIQKQCIFFISKNGPKNYFKGFYYIFRILGMFFF